MKYTFLLPAFKGRFLDEMLRSIQGQTYRDFKVIISDDCSPEDLRSICEPYLADSIEDLFSPNFPQFVSKQGHRGPL